MISRAWNGKNILITGATGFLGKVFLERLLNACPGIGEVHLLIRPSGSRDSIDRIENDVFSSPLFDRLKEETSAWKEKVRIVRGDLSLARFGLEPETYIDLLERVDLVANVAASTDFMDRIDRAVVLNALSVRNACEFVRLSAKARLLHVSTCYVGENLRDFVKEEPSPAPQGASSALPRLANGEPDVERILIRIDDIVRDAQAAKRGEKELEAELEKAGHDFAVAHGWNNIYTFTKWLGEWILLQSRMDRPSSIVRPSIIESCIYAPEPGWIEGLKVADPLIYAGGTGMLKHFPGDPSAVIDMIPVDLVANSLLVVGAKTLLERESGAAFYQACSGSDNPLRARDLSREVQKTFRPNEEPRRFFVPPALFHAAVTIAAIGLGLLALVTSDPRMKAARRKLDKLRKLVDVFGPYASVRVRFENSRLTAAHAQLEEKDRRRFPVSMSGVAWKWYLAKVHVPGLLRNVIGTGGRKWRSDRAFVSRSETSHAIAAGRSSMC